MDKKCNLENFVLQLSAPYKRSEAYNRFGVRANKCKNKISKSVFWDNNRSYVVKYENAKLQRLYFSRNQSQQIEEKEISLPPIHEKSSRVKRLLKTRRK